MNTSRPCGGDCLDDRRAHLQSLLEDRRAGHALRRGEEGAVERDDGLDGVALDHLRSKGSSKVFRSLLVAALELLSTNANAEFLLSVTHSA